LLPGFSASPGSAFTLLANQGSHPTSGTFAGLAEGATLGVDGWSFRPSYLGGAGHDVALTVLSSPPTWLVSDQGPSIADRPVTFTDTIANTLGVAPTGTVTFLDGATVLGMAPVASGPLGYTATWTTSTLLAGAHPISAVYSGDATYPGGTSTLSQSVQQLGSYTSLTASPGPAAPASPVTLTAAVIGDPAGGAPTGSVTFFNGSTALGTVALDGSGQATFTTSALPSGDDPLTAVYSGDSTFTGNTSAPVTETVQQFATTTWLAADHAPSVPGQAVTFTAIVSGGPADGIPTGSITFSDGSTALGTVALDGSGQATFTTSALLLGDHPITAVYSGDTAFTGSTSGLLTQTVQQPTTWAWLAADYDPSVPGQPVTFTATVTSSTADAPTGTVTFYDGSTALMTVSLTPATQGAQATFTTSGLALGGHTITAVYSGDATFADSISDDWAQTVQ
jgi:hypothetical protein